MRRTTLLIPLVLIDMEMIGDFLLYLTLFIISYFLVEFLSKKLSKSHLNLPPSPPALPLIGHLHLLSPFVAKCLHKISSKYGPFLYLRLGSRPVVLVSSVSYATEIFKKHDVLVSGKPRLYSDDSLLFGESSFLAAPYGEYWRFMKKLCITELLGASQLQRSLRVRREEVSVFVERMVVKANKNESVDLGAELMKLINNNVCRMAMSTPCSKEDNEAHKFRQLVIDSFDLSGRIVLASLLGPFKKMGFWFNRNQMASVTRDYHELFDKILEEHEERAKRDGDGEDDQDLVDILLKVYRDENAKYKISKNQIKALLLELFIGGTDTSAQTIEWIMAELIEHPNVMNKVREEIELVVGTERMVEESDIRNLHYLQAVVKETMRLHPIGPAIPRQCLDDCKIQGCDIPKGTIIVFNAYSIMRDPAIWERPDEFYPERFLQEQDKKYTQNVSYVPFGAGRRMCPGSHLAMCMINVTVASMVQCFDWKVEGKVKLEYKAGLVMGMAHPLQCVPIVLFNPFKH